MAEIIEGQEPTQEQIQAEVATQMAISLNGGFAPAPKEGEAGTGAAAGGEGQQQAALQVDPFGLLKEKFGYQSHEDAIKEIGELRAFKASPPQAQHIEFENEDSAKLFKAWQAGKEDEVYDYLSERRQINKLLSAEVNKDTAADIVKLGMQLKYKDQKLTPEEINYKFNKTFALPAKPTQGAEEEPDEYKERVSAWQAIVDDKTMELMIEAKLAKPELLNSKAKLVLPEIESTVDEGYSTYMKNRETSQKAADEATEAYRKFTPKAAATKVNFNDEANKIALEFEYEPDAESFQKSVEAACDIEKFWGIFRKPDGTPDREKFLRTINFALNEEKPLLEAMKQAKNATIKSMLPDNANGAVVRQMPQSQGEENELDKQMKLSLAGWVK